MNSPYGVSMSGKGWAVGRWVGNGRQWETERSCDSFGEAVEWADRLNGETDKPPLTCFSTCQPTPMGSPLIRLEMGAWIDPASVLIVSVDDGPLEPGRVVKVSMAHQGQLVIRCDSRDVASAMADRIAAQINAARRGEQPS
jgi:hypothetical protein